MSDARFENEALFVFVLNPGKELRHFVGDSVGMRGDKVHDFTATVL